MGAERLSVTAVRHAEPTDLVQLRDIERAADEPFAPYLDTREWSAAEGAERLARPGWVLVVGQPVAGFAHVLDLGGRFHLEQISVHPDAAGRGLGVMLLNAALGSVWDAGGDRLTLVAFADVPWNAPWYARHGFRELVESVEAASWRALAGVREAEDRLGLPRLGRRVAMVRAIRDEPAPVAAVSVLPVRDGSRGMEAFVQHRVSTMDFAAGALVFPGGRVDAGDRATGAELDMPADLVAEHVRAWRHTAFAELGDPVTAARTVLATAVREVAEETGARIEPARLLPWDDWVTPMGYPRRFDVRFLLYPTTRAEEAAFRHTTTEAHGSQWLPLTEIVERTEAGLLTLLPPTRTLVDELAALGSVAAAVSLHPEVAAVRHDLTPTRPRPRREAQVEEEVVRS